MSTPFKMKGHTLPGPMQKKGKVNPFSAEYKRMTKSQRTAKYGEGYEKIGSGKKAINRENVAVSLGKLDTKIKGALNTIDKKIKGPEGGSYLKVSKGPKGISIKNTPGVNPNPGGGSKKTTSKKTTSKKTSTSTSTSNKPNWSKAPKNNTQARRDWYTKHNLAQDATTKLD